MKAEIPARKTCKMCCQEIDGRAKKCPFCHHWQHPLLTLGYSPATAVVPIGLFVILFGFMMTRVFNQGEPFEPHQAELTVTQSEMKFGETECGPTVVILGTLSNSGDRGWKDVNAEVKFMDKTGKMIDGDQERQYFAEILPHSETVFKVSMKREFPANQYANYTITIVSARDRQAWP